MYLMIYVDIFHVIFELSRPPPPRDELKFTPIRARLISILYAIR